MCEHAFLDGFIFWRINDQEKEQKTIVYNVDIYSSSKTKHCTSTGFFTFGLEK